jgi:hypothetical protein
LTAVLRHREIVSPMDDPLPFRRAWQYGALALLLPALLGLGLRLAGYGQEIIGGVAIAGAIGGIFVVVLTVRRDALAVVVAAIILMVVAPLAAVIVAEGRAAGPILHVAAGQAATHRLAAGFIFTDGSMPRVDLQQTVTIGEVTPTGRAPRSGWGSSGGVDLPALPNTFFTYAVVPVVPPGWTPDQPVRVVAVDGDRSIVSVRPPCRAHSAEPGGLLRTVSEDRESRAAREALGRRGLIAAPDLVVGLWVPSPGWARLDAVLPSLMVLAVALALWTGLLLLGRRAARPRGRRR